MLAIISGKMRVKGTSNKDVSYMGAVQEDGYIYFNDEHFYRCSSPASIDVDEEYDATNIQVFYIPTKQWIRSNKFTSLKIRGFSLDDILDKIQEATDEAIRAIQDAADAARATLDLDGHVRENGDALNMAAIIINDIVPVVNREHHTSISPFNHTIYR